MDNTWDELSRRLYGFNRRLVKQYAYQIICGGSIDPWIDYLIMYELGRIRHG